MDFRALALLPLFLLSASETTVRGVENSSLSFFFLAGVFGFATLLVEEVFFSDLIFLLGPFCPSKEDLRLCYFELA